jgi:hypothetical protein
VVYKLFGSGAVFALATALFATAGLLMLRQDRRSAREVAVEPTPGPADVARVPGKGEA